MPSKEVMLESYMKSVKAFNHKVASDLFGKTMNLKQYHVYTSMTGTAQILFSKCLGVRKSDSQYQEIYESESRTPNIRNLGVRKSDSQYQEI